MLSRDDVVGFVREQLAGDDLDGRSVCVVVPDATRSCPLPLLVEAVHGALHGRVSRLTVLVALGTHAPMSPAQLAPTSAARTGSWRSGSRAPTSATTSGRTPARS